MALAVSNLVVPAPPPSPSFFCFTPQVPGPPSFFFLYAHTCSFSTFHYLTVEYLMRKQDGDDAHAEGLPTVCSDLHRLFLARGDNSAFRSIYVHALTQHLPVVYNATRNLYAYSGDGLEYQNYITRADHQVSNKYVNTARRCLYLLFFTISQFTLTDPNFFVVVALDFVRAGVATLLSARSLRALCGSRPSLRLTCQELCAKNGTQLRAQNARNRATTVKLALTPLLLPPGPPKQRHLAHPAVAIVRAPLLSTNIESRQKGDIRQPPRARLYLPILPRLRRFERARRVLFHPLSTVLIFVYLKQ